MNKTLKRKWVKALRSGRYTQTKYFLNGNDGSNCCLGVLCRVARKPVDYLSLPELGITASLQNRFIKMNDIKAWPFEKIADHIAKHL